MALRYKELVTVVFVMSFYYVFSTYRIKYLLNYYFVTLVR